MHLGNDPLITRLHIDGLHIEGSENKTKNDIESSKKGLENGKDNFQLIYRKILWT